MLQEGGFDIDFVGSGIGGQDAVPPFDPDNEGHPGWTAGGVASTVYSFLVNNPADVVLLHIGTNGLTTNPADVEAILNEIDRFEADYDNPVTVFLARIINRVPYSATTTQFNENVAAMAQSRINNQGDRIALVDMENGAGLVYTIDTSGVAGDMYDYLHPNFRGYQKMAAEWYSHLRPFLLGGSCPEGMSHYWRLDETAGQPYQDSHGTAMATCSSCPTPGTGVVNGAQLFDGAVTVTVSDDGTFDWDPPSSFSIEVWMRKESSSGVTEVVAGRYGGPGRGSWWLAVDIADRVQFNLSDSSNTATAQGTSDVVDGSWHHVAAVRSGTSNLIQVYVDGAAQGAVSASFQQGFSSSAPLTIGCFSTGSPGCYSGLIDEVATYDSALTDVQVISHFNNGRAGLGYCDRAAVVPAFSSTPPSTGFVDRAYAYEAKATGYPQPIFMLATSPPSIVIDEVTGNITWTPSQPGSYSVSVIAANAIGADTQNFMIDVVYPPACPFGTTHYWDMNEGAGPTYVDRFGTNATCTLCPTAAAGKVGNAQLFDGNDSVVVADDNTYDWGPTAGFSIEFWMRQTLGCAGSSSVNNEVIVGRFATLTHSWWLGVNCDPAAQGRMRFRLNDGGGSADVFSRTIVTDGLWHHVAAVREGDAGKTYMYIDGIKEDSVLHTYTDGFALSVPLTIGQYNYPPYYRYRGTLDELALYDRALADSEITDHYDRGRLHGAGFCFVCGDADNNGMVNVSDAVYLVAYVFGGGAAPVPLRLGDVDCSGFVNVSDAVYLIVYIFGGGQGPCGCSL
jgi:hypothetical protein